MSTQTTLALALTMQSLTRHHLLMKQLLDLPPCLFDIRKCAMSEAVLGGVPKPVLPPVFPGLQEMDAEETKVLRVLVRRVVDMQEKVEGVRAALQAKVKGYTEALEEGSVYLET